MYETKPYFYGTGRRKDSVARVRVYTGTGKVTINDRDIDNYFGLETLKLIVRSPLVLLGLEGKYDVVVRVSGGGVFGYGKFISCSLTENSGQKLLPTNMHRMAPAVLHTLIWTEAVVGLTMTARV